MSGLFGSGKLERDFRGVFARVLAFEDLIPAFADVPQVANVRWISATPIPYTVSLFVSDGYTHGAEERAGW